MPLFEFECRKCGHRFEALVLGSQRASCPKCKGRKLEQVYSAFAMSRSAGGRRNAAGSTAGSCGAGSGGGG